MAGKPTARTVKAMRLVLGKMTPWAAATQAGIAPVTPLPQPPAWHVEARGAGGARRKALRAGGVLQGPQAQG
jgi:hypothetical protein